MQLQKSRNILENVEIRTPKLHVFFRVSKQAVCNLQKNPSGDLAQPSYICDSLASKVPGSCFMDVTKEFTAYLNQNQNAIQKDLNKK